MPQTANNKKKKGKKHRRVNTDHVFINVNVEQVNNILVSYTGPNQVIKSNKKDKSVPQPNMSNFTIQRQPGVNNVTTKSFRKKSNLPYSVQLPDLVVNKNQINMNAS